MQIKHTTVFDMLESKSLEPDNKHKNEKLKKGILKSTLFLTFWPYIYMGKHTKMELASDSRIICTMQDFEDQEIRL